MSAFLFVRKDIEKKVSSHPEKPYPGYVAVITLSSQAAKAKKKFFLK